MNRRNFVTHAMTVTGLTVIAARSNAQITPPTPKPTPTTAPIPQERIVVTHTVANNHGHTLVLSDVGVVKALRTVTPTAPIAIDIKGTASHPHKVSLSKELIVELLVNGTIDVVTSTDAGHSHKVNVKLGIGIPTDGGVVLSFGNF